MDNLFQLKRSQIDYAAEVLTRAFEKDPLFIAYFPDSTKRTEQNYQLMKFCIRYSMRLGEVYTTSPKLEGIALWQFEDSLEKQKEKPRSLFANWLSFRLEVDLGEIVQNVYSIYEHIISTQHELIPSAHWYLQIIGVDPFFQKKGFASRLIKPMLARIDKEQLSCYLDTNIEKNVEIYQYFGFKILKKYQIPGTNVINWSMLRE